MSCRYFSWLHGYASPEGGFSAGEVESIRHEMEIISLGNRILRTETAGLAALAMLLYEVSKNRIGADTAGCSIFVVTKCIPARLFAMAAPSMAESITPETILVSIMYVNNEIGAVCPRR